MSIESVYQAFVHSSGVCTDTRSITNDCIFFALKGDRFNGNDYALKALEEGAKFAVIDEPQTNNDERLLLVDNVLTTLQQVANHHRRQFNIPVLAITGSNGKTTTKELIRAVLSKKFKVHATEGNLNNHIGVPLTLLKIDSLTEMAIIEMGANHLGEIAALCEIAAPDFGIITNIGRAHLEGFGSFEGVIRAKSELYQFLISHDGVVFINSQNEILHNMSKRFKAPIFYPAEQDFYHCEFVSAEPYVVVKTKDQELVNSNLIGSYNFENISAALCIGNYFGVDETLLAQAIEGYKPSNNRSQMVKTAHNQIILDAYNANPNSMKAALLNFDQMAATHKTAIIGDMFELGETSEAEHLKIGTLLSGMAIDRVLTCGKESKVITNSYAKAHYFEGKDALAAYLKDQPVQNNLVLIKASRGMGLETLVELL